MGKDTRTGELLTADQAAKRWGIRPATLRRRIRSARLPPVTHGWGRVGAKYRAADLKRLATTTPEREQTGRTRVRPPAPEARCPIEECCGAHLLTDADRRELARRRAKVA